MKAQKIFLLLFILILSIGTTKASGSETGEYDPFQTVMHHISDAHEWHFFSIDDNHFSLPLPVILYSKEKGVEIFSSSHFYHSENKTYNGYVLDDHEHIYKVDEAGEETIHVNGVEMKASKGPFDISITKNVASLLLSVVLLLVVFIAVANNYKSNKGKAPRGIASFFEPIIIFVRDELAKNNIGEKHHAKFVPYLLTLFFFIWFNNGLGLIPGGANLSGNISFTMLLAVFTLIVVNVSANKDYWVHIFATPGVPWWLLPIMIPVEIIGILAKPFSLMMRLFANITAGHVMILVILGFGFMFESYSIGVAGALFATAMNCLEFFVALLQAYIFTLLTSIYLGLAVAEHEHEHAH